MRFHISIVMVATVLALAACGRVETSNPGAQASPVPQLPSSTATVAMRSTSTTTIQPTPEATAVGQQNGEATTEIVPQTSPRPAIDTIVIYSKSGGLVGISETMTVYSDGRVELVKRGAQTQQMQLQPAELASLKQMLTNSDFAAVQSPTMPSTADAFIYEVSVPSSSGKVHTIKTSDGTQNPPALDKVLQELGRLREQIG